MSRRYDFQDILRRFQQTQDQRFRELSDAVARRILELLGGTTVPDDPPDPPSGLTATDDQEFQITLDWNPVATATGYNVYRSPVTENNFALIGSTPVSDYVDTGLPADTSFDYYVTAYNGDGESDPSSTETGTSIDGSAPSLPDTPANFRTTSNENQVVLAWDAFTGGTVACRIERSVDQLNWTVVANTSTLTFTDTNVSVGQTFYYRAYGVNATGVTSPATATLTVTVVDGDTTAPPVPVLLSGIPANQMISVTWEGVVASDLAGYEIGWGTSSGTYTNTSDLITGTQGNITGLTNGTRYYFAVRSVDTSLNENKSAWSNEQSDIAIDTADPGTTPDPPTAPTGLTSTSPEVNQIRVQFTPGQSSFLRRHRLYARVKPGQTIQGNPVDGTWSQIDQELQPATELGKDVTIFQGSLGYELSPVTWQFYVTAVDTYNQESAPSEIIEDIVDGEDWAFGPGGGPIGGQNINGDTGLGANHRAPGFTFDFAIDVSDTTQYAGDAVERAAAIFNNRRNLDPSNPDFIQLSTDDTAHIAILLPTETVNKRLHINTGDTSTGGEQAREAANFDFGGDPGFESQIALHFIGPWAQGTDTFLEAQTRMRDNPGSATLGYKRTFKDSDNKSKFNDNTGADIIVGDITRQNAEGVFYFWNWDVEVSSKDGIRLGSDGDRGSDFKSHKFDVVFNLCKIHQDAILPKVEAIGQRGVTARYIRPSLIGCFIDLPWQSGAAVQALSPMRGSFAVTNTRVARAGGAAFQMYTRSTFDSGLPAGTDPGSLTFTGVRHWDDWPTINDGIGRASEAGTFFFDLGGVEQNVTLADCHVIETKSANFRRLADWPPGDPYDWRVYTTFVRQTNSALRMQYLGIERPLASGYRTGAISMSNCLFYSKVPIRPVVDIEHASSITLTSVGAFTDEQAEVLSYDSAGVSTSLGDSSLTGYRYGNSTPYKPGGAPFTIGAMSATGLNTNTMRNTLASAYSLTAAEVAVANADIEFVPDTVDHFEVTEDHSFNSFTPPHQLFLQPAGLNPPEPPPTLELIDAIDMYDRGLTMPQAKLEAIPALVASRSPRADATGNVNVRRWAYRGPGTGYAATGDWQIHFGNNLSGPSTNPYVRFADNFCVMHIEDVDLRFPGSQKCFSSDYETNKYISSTWETSTANQNPAVPNGEEDVFPREASDKWGAPNPVKEYVTNCYFGDHGDRRRYERPEYSGNAGLNSDVKWAIRHNGLVDVTFENCDWQYVHQEHACYFNSMGDAEWRNCTFRDIGSQGLQVVNRSDSWGKKIHDPNDVENPEYFNDETRGGNRILRNCHFADVGNWSNQSQNKSSVINFYSAGYPDSPAELVAMVDCSIVTGLTFAESSAERAAAGDPDTSPYFLRDSQGGDKQSSSLFALILEDQGSQAGQQLDPTHAESGSGSAISAKLFRTPFATAAAARADNAATMHQMVYFKNCYFHQQDAANPMFRFDSCHTIIFENCVFIHDEVYGTTQRAFSIDSGLSAYCEPGAWNYMADGDLHGTHNLIFRNCRAEMRDVTEGRVVTSTSPMSIRWSHVETDDISFIGFGNSVNQELHFKGLQGGRTEPILDYQGPIDPNRPGYIAPPVV